MRPVLSVDLICAARAVLAAPGTLQGSVAQALIAEADMADWYRETYGELHPRFGDGTLAAAARNAGMAEERTMCDSGFAAAMIVVLQTLMRHKVRDLSRG